MLGDDGVTRKQRRTDLAAEDRQREVPRTDAREYATADELQFIALAGRPRQRQRREPRPCLFRVVTPEVDRLAYFGKRIGNDLAGLADGQPPPRRAKLPRTVPGTVTQGSAFVTRACALIRIPGGASQR